MGKHCCDNTYLRHTLTRTRDETDCNLGIKREKNNTREEKKPEVTDEGFIVSGTTFYRVDKTTSRPWLTSLATRGILANQKPAAPMLTDRKPTAGTECISSACMQEPPFFDCRLPLYPTTLAIIIITQRVLKRGESRPVRGSTSAPVKQPSKHRRPLWGP